MKKYIKPSVSVVEFETGAALLAAVSGVETIIVDSKNHNDTDRAKESDFDLDLWED